MKNFLLLVLTAVTFMMFGMSQCQAATKCVPDGRGGMCCWDTDRDGPWKPIGC
jgi:hypothetical protein